MRHICNVPVHVTMMILSRWDTFISRWHCIELFRECTTASNVESSPEQFYTYNLEAISKMAIYLHVYKSTESLKFIDFDLS
jgi:hypothetical protein